MAFERVRNENRAGADLLSLVDIAERFFHEIDTPCLEAARFMQNEFGIGNREDRLDRLAMCAFVDQVLATCWSVEERLAPAALRTAVEKCAALLGYCHLQNP